MASAHPLSRSCQFCRARKIKCDAAKPTCASCLRHRRACVYLVEPARQRPSKALINAAHRRRQAAENVLIALKQAEPGARDAILDTVILQPDGSLQLPSRYTVDINEKENVVSTPIQTPRGTPRETPRQEDPDDQSTSDEEYDPTTFVSRDECGTVGIFGPTSALHAHSPADDDMSSPRVHSRTEPDRYQLIAEAALQRQKEHDLRHMPIIGGIPAELAMHLLDLHWNRQHHTFLLTYRPAFMRDLHHGGSYCSEFLLNAVFACSSKFSSRLEVRADPNRPETAGKRFFDRCDQLLAEQGLLTRSSIPTITGLLMLGSTFNAWGQTSKGWLYTGFALRMVYDMGLHLDCQEVAGSSAEDIEVRRRVFWAAFICDKLQSLYFGRPFTIQLRDAHVSRDFMDTFEENELWTPYIDPLMPSSPGSVSPQPTRIHSVSVFQQLCALSKLMTIIIDRFYMTRASGPKALKYLTRIDRRLTIWYQRLPASLRFEPWTDNHIPIVAPNALILLTTYNALVILLHRPLIGNNGNSKNVNGIDSWERCLTAARNITSLALAYRAAYSLRRANYLLSYAVYVACTIHARNPAIRESTRRKESSSPLTVCLRCLDELAVPNCGVSAPARIIRRLMRANEMEVESEPDVVPETFPVDVNLDFQNLPLPDMLDLSRTDDPFTFQNMDLLFGFMNGDIDINDPFIQ